MLDFIKNLVSLNCPITDWIMAIATVILVVIAGMANGTWKRELRAKKRYDLANNLLDVILIIEAFIQDKNVSIETLEKTCADFKNIEFQYQILCENYDFISYFKEKLVTFNYLKTDKFMHVISLKNSLYEDINITRENIEKVKEFCKKEMKDFYKP